MSLLCCCGSRLIMNINASYKHHDCGFLLWVLNTVLKSQRQKALTFYLEDQKTHKQKNRLFSTWKIGHYNRLERSGNQWNEKFLQTTRGSWHKCRRKQRIWGEAVWWALLLLQWWQIWHILLNSTSLSVLRHNLKENTFSENEMGKKRNKKNLIQFANDNKKYNSKNISKDKHVKTSIKQLDQ